MAELLSIPQLGVSETWSPKQQHRFIFQIDGIPTYLINKAGRPSFNNNVIVLDQLNNKRYFKGKAQWQQINISLYDPIVPSGAQLVMQWLRAHHMSVTGMDGYKAMYQKDVTLKLVGPPGDVIEK